MSQSALTAEHGVPWPSNGISEIPFRVYTDQDQYHREQEHLFKGPTWNYLCLSVEVKNTGDFVTTFRSAFRRLRGFSRLSFLDSERLHG